MRCSFVLVLLLSIATGNLRAQEASKKINLIIVVDQNVAVGSLSHFLLKIKTPEGENSLPVGYYPGDLDVRETDFRKLICGTTKSFNLQFNYSEFKGGKQVVYNYDIEFKKEWLDENFLIFRLYNLSKKKYKKRFRSVETGGKKYVFELDSPRYSFRYVE